jgi:hypothetical protein
MRHPGKQLSASYFDFYHALDGKSAAFSENYIHY